MMEPHVHIPNEFLSNKKSGQGNAPFLETAHADFVFDRDAQRIRLITVLDRASDQYSHHTDILHVHP